MSLIRNVSLVREASQPHVYFVCGGAKMWIPGPTEFDSMGFDWGKIQVVPDGALNGYASKPFVNPNSPVKPSDVFFDGSDDDERGKRESKDPASIVSKNIILAGWLDDHGAPHPDEAPRHPYANCRYAEWAGGKEETVTEDFHYDFIPDPDFLMKVYGPGGLSTALNRVVLPGNPVNPMRFDDVSETDGASRGITLNSFALPGNKVGGFFKTFRVCIIGELNCWKVIGRHKLFVRRWWDGRGSAPSGWVAGNYCALDAQFGAFWPFDPPNPDNGPENLHRGDYVLMKGTLWQDFEHGLAIKNWDRGPTAGHSGHLEMHPIDWILRVGAPLPGQRRTGVLLEVCTIPSNQDSLVETGFQIYPDFDKFYPAFQVSSPGNLQAQVLKVREIEELVDGRFTDLGTVWKHFALNMRDHVDVQVGVRHSGPTGQQGRFKGVYTVTWEVPGPAVCASNPLTPQWDICIRGWDDAIYYRWFNALPATPWKSLSGTFNSDPAVAAVSPTVIYVFARGIDEAIWFTRVELTNTGSSAANWQSMGGEFTSSPAACALASGQMFVFARGRDKGLWYTRFTGQSWDNWKSLGGVLTSDPAAVAMRDPAAVPTRDIVEVFVRGTDEAIYHLFMYPDGTPSPWERIEGYWTSAPAVCSPDPANYVLDLFARGSDNAMWHRRRDGLTWQPWHSLGGVLASDPAAVCSGGRTYVFARGTDEKLWFSWLTAMQTGPWQQLAVDLPPAPPPPPPRMLLSVEPTPTPTRRRIS